MKSNQQFFSPILFFVEFHAQLSFFKKTTSNLIWSQTIFHKELNNWDRLVSDRLEISMLREEHSDQELFFHFFEQNNLFNNFKYRRL